MSHRERCALTHVIKQGATTEQDDHLSLAREQGWNRAGFMVPVLGEIFLQPRPEDVSSC
jgi:hypothetical protein